MSDKTLMVYCHGTHQKDPRKGWDFLTHPTKSSPRIPFICDNISDQIDHELYLFGHLRAIKLVSISTGQE